MKAIYPYHPVHRFPFFALCGLIMVFSACKDKEDPPSTKNYDPYPAVVKTMLFENGAWWAFEDSATLKKDTLLLSFAYWGFQNVYEGKKFMYKRFTYHANLLQTSTNRKFMIEYISSHDANYKHVHTPIVDLIAFSVVFPPNNYRGTGFESIFFNTTVGDTMNSGYAIINVGNISSQLVLQEIGIGISMLGFDYNEPYYKIKILNSVAYDRKDLELWLIENVGFAHHNIGGNYYLVDHSATNIVP